MKFHIITIFPDSFNSYLNTSILKRAIENKNIEIIFYDIADFSKLKTRRVDDKPFWWFPWAIISPEPLSKAIEKIFGIHWKLDIYLLSPRWRKIRQSVLENFAKKLKDCILICGHYEWIDQRIIDIYWVKEVSIWDYILTSWELAAMVLIDWITRLIPWVISKESLEEESFSKNINRRKEYPQYTRPREFMWKNVPEELLSGDPKIIKKWKETFIN